MCQKVLQSSRTETCLYKGKKHKLGQRSELWPEQNSQPTQNHFLMHLSGEVDYFTTVFTGLCKQKSIRQLQLIQNAVCWVLKLRNWTASPQFSHHAVVLSQKTLWIWCDVMNNPEPLKSFGTGLVSVPWVKNKHEEVPLSFYAIWNKLPESRSAVTLTSIKSRLETFLFANALQ